MKIRKLKVSTILKRTTDLLSDKSHWTKKAFARNKYGHVVHLHEERACKFCAVGAIQHVCTSYDDSVRALKFVEKHGEFGEYVTLLMFNDKNNHGTVINELKRLTTKARKLRV